MFKCLLETLFVKYKNNGDKLTIKIKKNIYMCNITVEIDNSKIF